MLQFTTILKKIKLFDVLINKLKKAQSLKPNEFWIFAVDIDLKNKIIHLNTIEQLYELGVDSLGDSLGEYSDFTIEQKKEKGQRYDHITLQDEGDFYKSFRVKQDKDNIIIIAKDTGKYDEPLTESFGKEIIGLTKESKESLSLEIKQRLLKFLKQKI